MLKGVQSEATAPLKEQVKGKLIHFFFEKILF